MSNYKPAEVYTLEEMLERFLYVEGNDTVQDLKHAWKIVSMTQFVKSHRSSKTNLPNGKSTGKWVETTSLWEHSPLRKQAIVYDQALAYEHYHAEGLPDLTGTAVASKK
jgi:hypothetical protein